MTIESIRRWEAFLESDIGSRMSVVVAMLAIVIATALLAAKLPPLPSAVVAVEAQTEAPQGAPFTLPVVLVEAPR